MAKSKLGEMSPGEAERLLEKAIRLYGATGDEKYLKDINIILGMVSDIKKLPKGIRDKVLKILKKN